MGITILAAAGDNGSSDGLSGDHVDFPASSPHVTGCGGTRLLAPDKKTIQSETVWNDGSRGGATGGGVSKVFAVPSFQRGLKVSHADKSTSVLTGRGVPDIAANADPVTGYDVLVDGQRFAIGGTSAVAPLLAGMIAVFNQQIGKPVGLWNPILYSGDRHSARHFDWNQWLVCRSPRLGCLYWCGSASRLENVGGTQRTISQNCVSGV